MTLLHAPTRTADDAELLSEFSATGNAEAFRQLVDRHLPTVHAAARRILGPNLASHADDITQSVFILLAQKAGKIHDRAPVVGWLYQVTHYACANLQKAERRRRQRETAAMRPTTSVPPAISDAEALLDPALQSLSAQGRDVVLLRYAQNLSIAEIARLTQLPAVTAKKRLRRALAELRKYFAACGMLSAAPVALHALAPTHSAALASMASAVATAALAPATAAAGNSVLIAKGVAHMMHVGATTKVTLATATILLLLIGGPVTIDLLKSSPAAPVTPAPAPVATAGPAEAVRNTFPRGGQVELIAVSSSEDPKVWWSPDGTPLPQAPGGADFKDLRDPWGETRVTYQFALRITDLPADAGPLYLNTHGGPRVAPSVGLQRDANDPTIFHGAALLYGDQPTESRLSVSFASRPWQRLTLNATGVAVPAIPTGSYFYTFLGPPIRNLNPAFEKGGKTYLILNGEPWGELEYQAVAITRDGASKPARDTFLGPVMGINRFERYETGLFSAWVFDAPLGDIDHYEVSVRQVDQRASFKDVALKAGLHAPVAPLIDKGGGSVPYDGTFSKLFYSIGDHLENGDVAAAAKACDEVLTQARSRRAELQASGSPFLYAVDHGMPILVQLDEALHKNDLPTVASLLESSNGNGIRLLNGIQTLGLYTSAPKLP